jgi:hypothetical protein
LRQCVAGGCWIAVPTRIPLHASTFPSLLIAGNRPSRSGRLVRLLRDVHSLSRVAATQSSFVAHASWAPL